MRDQQSSPLPCQGAPHPSSSSSVYIFAQLNATLFGTAGIRPAAIHVHRLRSRRRFLVLYGNTLPEPTHGRTVVSATPIRPSASPSTNCEASSGGVPVREEPSERQAPWTHTRHQSRQSGFLSSRWEDPRRGRSGLPHTGAWLPLRDSLQAIVRCGVVTRREKRRRLASPRHICRRAVLTVLLDNRISWLLYCDTFADSTPSLGRTRKLEQVNELAGSRLSPGYSVRRSRW